LLTGSNRAWGSRVVDQSATAWTDFFLDQVIAPLWQAGYRGFFLDTLDSYQLVAKTPESRALQEAGMRRTIHALKTRWPAARLIVNRGFEILPQIHNDVWMVAAESLYRGWDAAAGRFVEVPEKDRQWLSTKLKSVQADYGKPVLVIDYVPAGNRKLARETAHRLRADGFIPWVSVPALDQLGVGSVEVLPRRVLVLYNPTESPDLHYSDPLRFLGMPMAWLGLAPDYVPVNGPLPDYPLTGRYAGIISWINSDEVADAGRYSAWLERQVDAGVPLAVFSRFGMAYDNPLLRKLGLQFFEADKSALLKVTARHAMTGFELPVHTASGRVVSAAAERRGAAAADYSLLGGAGLPPGGLDRLGRLCAGALYRRVELPGQDNGERWYINPLTFLSQALKLDPSIPVADLTTENGRRLLMVHIDGDGFASGAERPGAPPSGQVLRDELLKKYPLPTTMSVIEGEVGANGLYPAKSAQLEGIARDIFALPWVEAASHSFSHPFNWGKAESNLDDGESYHLAIPGYAYNVNREIGGSLDYINQRLTPKDKPAKVFLWTGNCVATPEALAAAAKRGGAEHERRRYGDYAQPQFLDADCRAGPAA
jgi:hypothetical protein